MIDVKQLEEVMTYLCEELGGDWLLTGGALVRLNFDASRGTEDIDLVRISHPALSDEATRTQLFRWLMSRNLGPEWVNTAVEPFVREVANWENEILIIRTGTAGKIYRPNLTLFTYLKLRRGTEIDLLDIKKAVPKCPEGFDEKKFLKWANEVVEARYRKERAKLSFR